MLDDPTSSLDNKTIHYIMENIQNDDHWSTKTYLMVSNNLKTLNYCDKVVYMHKGRIQFFGTPETFKQTEQYAELACLQNQESQQPETQKKSPSKKVTQHLCSSLILKNRIKSRKSTTVSTSLNKNQKPKDS